MSDTNEAQLEEQIDDNENAFDMEGLINRINSDPSFAQSIVRNGVDSVLESEGQSVSGTEDTIDEEKKENAEELEGNTQGSAGKKILVDVDDLEYSTNNGKVMKFKTVGEVLKSNKEKESFIEELLPLKNRNLELEQQIAELQSRVNSANNAASNQNQESISTGNDEEIDVFSPDYLKKISKTERELQTLRDKLEEFEREKINNKKQEEKKSETNKAFSEIESFQNDFPEFKTKTPVAEIDKEYSSMISKIGLLAKTDGSYSANIKVMQKYLEDEGEEGEKIRTLAENNGIRLPDEFDTYVAISKLRNQALNSKIENRNFSLKEIYLYKKAIGQTDGLPNVTVNRNDSELRQQMREVGQKRQQEFAVDVDPSLSGNGSEEFNMSEDELISIIQNTTTDELRNNLTKLKTYNIAAKILGIKPVNPNAYR